MRRSRRRREEIIQEESEKVKKKRNRTVTRQMLGKGRNDHYNAYGSQCEVSIQSGVRYDSCACDIVWRESLKFRV